MKSTKSYLKVVIGFLLVASSILIVTSCEGPSQKRNQMEQLSREAFAFGYPLVLMDTSSKYMAAFSRSSDKQSKVPMYKFYHTRKVRETRYHDMASLDNDMIYSTAWLDLSKDPVVLTVPSSGKRFFVSGLIQGWSEIFGVVGTRATGNKKQRYLLSGPQWKGKTPAGMKPLRSSTNLVWIPIRINASGAGGGVSARAFQDGLRLTPLSQWGKNRSNLRMVEIDPGLDLNKAPRDQVFAMSANEYYTKLCALMVDNPPTPMDAAFVEKPRTIGIVPSKNFKFQDLPVQTQQALIESTKDTKNFILSRQGSFSPVGRLVNGWTMPLADAGFGTDYYRRAFEAYQGLGDLPPQDGFFPVAYEDNMGQQLMGENTYQITFEKSQIPPVNGFWSLTIYQLPDVKLIETPLRRYSLGQYNRLKYNPNGSLTIYVQPTSPGRDREANWLPSDKGNYQLTLKMYWPKKEVVEGRWVPPQIERMQQPRMTINAANE